MLKNRKSAPESRLLLELLDLADDLVEVGPITGIEFRMEQFAIGANFESAAARRNERERFDSFAEFKNLGRQTDGLGRVVSDDAIFDRDFRLHSGVLLSGKNGTELGKGGQGAREFSRRESVGTVRRRAVAETFYD